MQTWQGIIKAEQHRQALTGLNTGFDRGREPRSTKETHRKIRERDTENGKEDWTQ